VMRQQNGSGGRVQPGGFELRDDVRPGERAVLAGSTIAGCIAVSFVIDRLACAVSRRSHRAARLQAAVELVL
jgi:hypothetical protein